MKNQTNTKWVMNYPKTRRQRTLFIDGKVAKSQVVPRGEDELPVDTKRRERPYLSTSERTR